MDRKEWLTPGEAAAFLGTTRSTLAKLRCRGEGPPFSRLGGPGSAVRYSRADLEAWLRARRVVPGAAKGPAPAAVRKREQGA